MPQRADFPDMGELVVCSVTNVKNFGAFCTLDEYGGKEGFIHVRDVATGWVKYIRDHVREGQKIVCKVLGVDAEKGHIDLSLKQVNDHARREKIQEWKNEKKAYKLLEIVGTKMGKSLDEAYAEVGDQLVKEFGSLYAVFEQVTTDADTLKDLGLDKKWVTTITEVAKENIELPSVTIDGVVEITCPASDGIDHIKKALERGFDSDEGEIKIHYIGAPRYKISVKAQDYKIAEQEMKDSVQRISTAIQKAGGSASFKRKEEK
jgi:translation initiation factor 2 subunit 1